MRKIVQYQTEDGNVFPTKEEASAHEARENLKFQSAYKKFTEISYNGRELLKKHSLQEIGTWEVRGEDPNCDLHGSHYQPFIGLFSGTLKNVIENAVMQPSFWTWGAGGNIIKRDIQNV